ncbi:TetR/AcrR family transcriptional regulator [Mesobaculum littorinae]|uniref:TetR/AcrR family transcriptional regulator n=1 Tax=Mesobaculum littorinae TaxID=2486419 RepID=A0A438AM81_9RHOB|nr:TetR/AcrR family transcriptional regulator [Mesobaculum littorinae]RVV99951.1 TetR/AcrR family transcriptional regulator [Mesobaculum littorinae]
MAKADKNACGAEICGARPGRPVAISPEDRRRIVLDALDNQFGEAGMAGLTMTAIAGRAGMSKRTLYGLFADRDALFAAYMERAKTRFLRPLPPEARDAPLEQRLRLMLQPEGISAQLDLPLEILRIAVADGAAPTDLGRLCRENGSGQVRGLIQAELERACQRGEIRCEDVGAAAQLLKDMIQCPVLEILVDPSCRPNEADIAARFELGLATFLRAFAVT